MPLRSERGTIASAVDEPRNDSFPITLNLFSVPRCRERSSNSPKPPIIPLILKNPLSPVAAAGRMTERAAYPIRRGLATPEPFSP